MALIAPRHLAIVYKLGGGERMGTFDTTEFAEELKAAPENFQVGTTVWFENDRVRVWELLLRPGQRAPFHHHTLDYFWTCVAGGEGAQRTSDGTLTQNIYHEGDTKFLNTGSDPMIHDLENIGSTDLRFVTVELKS